MKKKKRTFGEFLNAIRSLETLSKELNQMQTPFNEGLKKHPKAFQKLIKPLHCHICEAGTSINYAKKILLDVIEQIEEDKETKTW